MNGAAAQILHKCTSMTQCAIRDYMGAENSTFYCVWQAVSQRFQLRSGSRSFRYMPSEFLKRVDLQLQPVDIQCEI